MPICSSPQSPDGVVGQLQAEAECIDSIRIRIVKEQVLALAPQSEPAMKPGRGTDVIALKNQVTARWNGRARREHIFSGIAAVAEAPVGDVGRAAPRIV